MIETIGKEAEKPHKCQKLDKLFDIVTGNTQLNGLLFGGMEGKMKGS